MILLNKTHSERKHYSMLKNLFKKIQKKSKTGFRLIRNIALAQVKEKTRLFKKIRNSANRETYQTNCDKWQRKNV